MNRTYLRAIFCLLFLNSFLGFSQINAVNSNVSDCLGAIQMESNSILKPKMPGNSGEVDDLKAYREKFEFKENNSLWFTFESPHSGWLRLAIEKFDFPLEYGVFILNEGEDCSEIYNGEVKLYTHQLLKDTEHAMEVDSIRYSKNEVVLLYVNTNSSINNTIAVQAKFTNEVSEEEYSSLKEVFDLRKSKLEKPFNIKIRDAQTKLPVVANIIISDSRTHNALYTASDIIVEYSDNIKMTLKIDASGYFFQDVFINTRKDQTVEQVVFLQALEQNQLIELEGLVFTSQSDALIPEAMPKLKRLKDFMFINTDVNIEVQGHVHLAGKNTSNAKRLSKKRAQSIKNSLVESGIDKKRITVVGFGNSKMRYPDAETDAEKQANRRVEIKIK